MFVLWHLSCSQASAWRVWPTPGTEFNQTFFTLRSGDARAMREDGALFRALRTDISFAAGVDI